MEFEKKKKKKEKKKKTHNAKNQKPIPELDNSVEFHIRVLFFRITEQKRAKTENRNNPMEQMRAGLCNMDS